MEGIREAVTERRAMADRVGFPVTVARVRAMEADGLPAMAAVGALPASEVEGMHRAVAATSAVGAAAIQVAEVEAIPPVAAVDTAGTTKRSS